ncbi:MAG: 30S ribosomal protein S3 [bacterium]|nr:30S ribosomal protein S3 [bacterium]
MGQKIHPISFRLGITHSHQSRWYADPKKYKTYLLQDVRLRVYLLKKLKSASVSRIEIERAVNKMVVIIFVARPGVVIGRGGSGLDELKKGLLVNLEISDPKNLELRVEEVKSPDLVAYLVATSAADQLAKRMPSKRVLKQTVERVSKAGAKGVKILLAGRINGAEIARRESAKQGTIPLHTLRADIDFAAVPALTKSGYIGVKVWINRGEKTI